MVLSSKYPSQVTWKTFQRPRSLPSQPLPPPLPYTIARRHVSPSGFVWLTENGEAVL